MSAISEEVTIIAHAPESGWAYIQKGGKYFLIYPPFHEDLFDNQVTEQEVRRSGQIGITPLNKTFQNVKEMMDYIEKKYCEHANPKILATPTSEILNKFLSTDINLFHNTLNHMDYKTFLNRIIDDGITACKADYIEEKQKEHLEGSIAGFDACRGLEPKELTALLQTANEYTQEAFIEKKENYWYFRCYQSEVEWVINVVSAMLVNQGEDPLLSYLPTANGMMKAAEILGVSSIS